MVQVLIIIPFNKWFPVEKIRFLIFQHAFSRKLKVCLSGIANTFFSYKLKTVILKGKLFLTVLALSIWFDDFTHSYWLIILFRENHFFGFMEDEIHFLWTWKYMLFNASLYFLYAMLMVESKKLFQHSLQESLYVNWNVPHYSGLCLK